MPETPFSVQFADGSTQSFYSPSSIVRQYFSVGDQLPVGDFVKKARSALNEASARVEAKFGYSCSGASASLAQIESRTGQLAPEESVTIIQI